MTTLWADGFDAGSLSDPAYDYTLSGTPSYTTGRRAGTYSLLITGGDSYTRPLGTTAGTLFFSLAIRSVFNAAGYSILCLSESGTSHLTFYGNATNGISVYRADNSGTLLGTTTANLIPQNVWSWVQVKVVISDTIGSVEIRDASGNVALLLTGIDTRNGLTGVIDAIKLGSTNITAQYGYDDLHVWDTTGTICNTWTSETRIDVLLPNAAGAVTQFTPSTGANWDCVNENSVSVTDYVSNAVAGNQDLYNFTDLPHVPLSIYGTVLSAVATKDDAGVRAVQTLCRSGTTTVNGPSLALNLGTWQRTSRVIEADPNTSAAWTVAGLNAAQFGVQTV